jgi:DNA-binding MarR family transcriptional regulator
MDDSSLGYLLQHTAVTMHRQTDQVLQERLGIGVAQFKILTTLQERPDVKQRFLAASLGQTEASISRQIKVLLEKGFLAVQIHPANKREHITALTAKGAKFTQAAREIVDKHHQPALERLSERERQQFIAIMQRLHSYCCRQGNPFACETPWHGPDEIR